MLVRTSLWNRNRRQTNVRDGRVDMRFMHANANPCLTTEADAGRESVDQRSRILGDGLIDLRLGGGGDALNQERLEIRGMHVAERRFER